MKYTHDIIIIGGGAAGLTTASGAAQLGMKTALIEGAQMGGDCLYYGCVPSKTLIKSARVNTLIQHASSYGLPNSTPLAPSATELMRRVQSVIGKLEPHDSPERFRSLGCEVYLERARFINSHELSLQSGTILSAKRIVIATGSVPSQPPIPGLAESGALTNKDIFSLEQLPKSAIVLGAGPIGVELGQTLQRLGSQVTIVDMADQILPREDADMADIVQKQLESDGIILKLGVKIIRISLSNGMKQVVIQESRDGVSVESVLEATEILSALGRRGNIDDLGLDVAGVESARGFIPVDRRLRTNVKHIMAIGDVNGSYLFTHTAGAEGSFAVRSMALGLPGAFSYKNTPWATYCDPELASIGYSEKSAKAQGLNFRVYVQDFASNDRALAESETAGRLKILCDPRDRIIGVQIVGSHAGELLLPGIHAVRKKWKLMELLGPVQPYPTMGEIYKRLAGSVAGPKLFNSRTRRLLRFIYGYRGRKD